MVDRPLPPTTAEMLQFLHRKVDGNVFIGGRAIAYPKGAAAPVTKGFDIKDARGINQFVEAHSGVMDVYFNARLSTTHQDTYSAKDIDIITYLFADIDIMKNVDTRLPATTEEARDFLEALSAPPSVILESGSGGLHAIWVLDRPIMIDDDQNHENASELLKRFQSWINHQGHLKGYQSFDSMADLPRIQRAPYSMNVKAGKNTYCRPVVVTDRVYTFSEITALIASVPANPASNDNSAPAYQRKLSRLDSQLDVIDRAWFEEALENKGRKRNSDPLAPNPAAIYAGCAFVRHANEGASTLSESKWHALISIFAHTKDGEKIIHEMSRNYPNYDPAETDRKIWDARRTSKPFGCDAVSKLHAGCSACPFSRADFNPIALGNRTKHQVELLADHVYVQQTQSIIDVAHGDRIGVSTKQFAEYHAHKRLLGSPEKAFLNDPLSRKVKERVYAPDLPYGLATIEEKVVFNTYRAPVHTNGCPESAKKFTDHLEYLIPDNVERNYLLKYLAHLVQKPWIKIASAITIVGAQGTGKSLLLNLMRDVLGASNVNVSKGASLKSNFNGQLSGHVLLGLEEVSIEGRAETYDMIKALITNPFDEFEQKFRNKECLPTPRGIILLTNDKYGLYLPDSNERRFSVLTATSQKRSPDYYKALFDFTPKFVAGVYDLLMKTDLAGFNPHAAPLSTAAKDKMAHNSKSEVDLAVRDLLDERLFPFDHDIQKFTDLQNAVNDRLQHKSGAKPIQRALEANGCVADGRQCRLKSGERPRLWLLRNAERYANLSVAELARAYEQQGKPPSLQLA